MDKQNYIAKNSHWCVLDGGEINVQVDLTGRSLSSSSGRIEGVFGRWRWETFGATGSDSDSSLWPSRRSRLQENRDTVVRTPPPIHPLPGESRAGQTPPRADGMQAGKIHRPGLRLLANESPSIPAMR